MNAARSGVTSWLKRRALPGNRQHVAIMVTDYEAGLVTCKGGKDDTTEVEMALIRNAGLARGACLLILEEAATRGLVHLKNDLGWDLHPGLARLVQFLGAERQALVALGLERREQNVGTLDEYLKGLADAPAPPPEPDTQETP
jgi:hypothetical protein